VSYEGLDNATLDFGPSSTAINRIVHCLKNLPFDDWRGPALVWLARKPNASETVRFFSALEGLAWLTRDQAKNKSVREVERIVDRELLRSGATVASLKSVVATSAT
jgi:hypothetical protein